MRCGDYPCPPQRFCGRYGCRWGAAS